MLGDRNSLDPSRNSFRNLIDFVSTGVDTPMDDADDGGEGGGGAEGEAGDHHHHHSKKKKDKKKKDTTAPEIEEAAEDVKKHKKDSKKKDKKKKKKKNKKSKDDGGGGEDGGDSQSDLELDSDDDLSLGSVPMSSSSEDEDEEAKTGGGGGTGLSRQVSKRASVADGLKGFQMQLNFQKPDQQQTQHPEPKPNSKRRHTLGAALKGFQIDVKSLQDNNTTDNNNDSTSGLDNLSKNLPTLSLANVRQNSRRQSSFDVFLKKASNNKDKEKEAKDSSS